ncbi:hypothetical protein [Sinomonas sp. ASV322]|uniref:hypothetical protein n=1 Tax=Sinomonas sp. ASV322 TaxID=3041920 RepID=UPI0027DDE804|nr:hypothetical protein [Sinomonas sp. ASV322]MDQ4501963.1 hypothetical protein [Sinomonas sp. ASV322]
MSAHRNYTSQRRPGVVDSIAGRVGAALVAWSERPRTPDPRIARLDEIDSVRDSARVWIRL